MCAAITVLAASDEIKVSISLNPMDEKHFVADFQARLRWSTFSGSYHIYVSKYKSHKLVGCV